MLKFKILLLPSIFLLFHFTSCSIQGNTNLSKNEAPSIISKKKDAINQSSSNTKTLGKLSIGQKIRDNNYLPVEERIELYHLLKKTSPDRYNFKSQDELNMYGYSLLWDGFHQDALAIFKLNVEQFPDWFEGYDSLGEGYLNKGNKEKALANYKKSVELNPKNHNGIDQINRINGTYKTPPKPANKFAKTFPAKSYKDDLDELGKKLIEINPNALKFITKKAFLKLIKKKKKLITNQTTYSEFSWHCSEIIASANCSHTSMGGFYKAWDMLPISLRFPLQTRWINDQLFIIDNQNNENNVAIKDEILSINGIAVSKLINDIYKHIPSQGYIKTSKRQDFNEWNTGMISYALNFPTTYKITVKGKDKPIILNTAQRSSYISPFKKPCSKELCFEILDDDTTAILTITTFNYYWWSNLNYFKKFIDNRFKEINEKGIKNLIIDVRFNGGGSPESSIYLLKHLINRPFVYYSNVPDDVGEGIQYPFDQAFKGQLYFIIDGNGNSTTGHFMSIAKDLNLGTIIGEELGSNQFCTAGQTICKLPNTELEYYIASSTCVSSATSLPDETGILPDHYVTQSIDDYLKGVDRVKKYTLDLIKK